MGKRIIISRTDRLGDVVMITGLVREIRKAYPDAFIATLTQPGPSRVFENNPHLNLIIKDDLSKESFWKVVKKIRSEKFDYGLLVIPTQRAAYQMFLAGIRTRIGVSLKLYGVLTFMKYVSRNNYIPLRHEADYCMDLARRIGVKTDNYRPEIHVTREERKWTEEFFDSTGAGKEKYRIIIHTGSKNSAPNWSEDKYFDLIRGIIRKFPMDPGLKSAGVTRGVDAGMTRGVDAGMTRGVDDGMKSGENDGMTRGVDDGMKSGENDGMTRGVDDGIKSGENDGMKSNGDFVILLTAIEMTEEFREKIKSLNDGRIIDISQKTGDLREFIKVISGTDLMICSSTGPAHLADALGIRSIVIHCHRAMNCAKHWGVLNGISVNLEATKEYCDANCSADKNDCNFENGISVEEVINNINFNIINEIQRTGK